MDDPFQRLLKARRLVTQLVGQWTVHGEHVNRGFSFSIPTGLLASGKMNFSGRQASWRRRITYEGLCKRTPVRNVSNRIRAKPFHRSRKYIYSPVDFPFSRFLSLSLSPSFFPNWVPSFFKRPFGANKRWCELMEITDYLGNCECFAGTAVSIDFFMKSSAYRATTRQSKNENSTSR